MDSVVFLLVMASAVFHASWNFYAKKTTADKTSLMVVGWLALGLAMAIALPWTVDFEELNSDWIKYSIATGIVHAAYVALLGWAYSIGEISIVYPIARGLGIFWTSLFSTILGIHAFSNNGKIGIIAIVAGVFAIGHQAMGSKIHRKAFLVSIAVSLAISFYSILDSFGAKIVPTFFYLVVMDIVSASIVLPFLYRRSPSNVLAVVKNHKMESLMVAIGGTASYFVILWAYKMAPVSYVAALRESSVIIAAILGLVFLKEEISKRKILGIALVTIGAIFLKWA